MVEVIRMAYIKVMLYVAQDNNLLHKDIFDSLTHRIVFPAIKVPNSNETLFFLTSYSTNTFNIISFLGYYYLLIF